MRVVDIGYRKTVKIADLQALREDDIKNAKRVLVVESSRRTGQTLDAIESRILQINSETEILDYVLVFSPGNDELRANPPQCYSYISSDLGKGCLRFPWYI
jgi:adenine/guanine phosphoribosyltransferase-like PRPP-binding protein